MEFGILPTSVHNFSIEEWRWHRKEGERKTDFIFTTGYSIALFILLIVLILLISVTYFHEMRSEDRATGTGERMKDPVLTTNISIEGRGPLALHSLRLYVRTPLSISLAHRRRRRQRSKENERVQRLKL